jgi:hypothetical protein
MLFLLTLRRILRITPKGKHRVWTAIGGAVCLGMLGLSVFPAILLPDKYQSASHSEPYGVCTVTYGWEDTSRLETFTPDLSGHRKISVQSWYPVNVAKTSATVTNASMATNQVN